jgi:hypothetical protein
MLYLKNPHKLLKHIIIILVVSTGIVPIIITDIWAEIYHRICFPLYGIPYLKRKDYIRIIDRAKLQYLNPIQKIYCMYCGYANGAIRYWARMGSETEHYWCGIQHKKDNNFPVPEYQKDFSKYGDEEDFKNKYCK